MIDEEAAEEKKKKEEEDSKKHPCAKKGCKNTTLHKFCSTCFRSQKETEQCYMISSCSNCGVRYKGGARFCSRECKDKAC